MKHKKHNYAEAPHYKKWVLARDRVLEDLHTLAQFEAADEMRKVLTHVMLLAKGYFHELKDPARVHHAVDRFDHQVTQVFRQGALCLVQVMQRMRRRSYILAKTSEGEILAQLNRKKEIQTRVNAVDLLGLESKDSLAGGKFHQRINFYMDRLRRRIVNSVQSAAIGAKNSDDFQYDVLQSFPRARRVKRPPRILKPKLMEAVRPKTDVSITTEPSGSKSWQDVYMGARDAGASSDEATLLLDREGEAAWDDMLDSYKKDFVPVWRAPEYVVDIPITDPTHQVTTGEDVWYAWEFERDLTNEFVKSVREGTVEAATENGVTDFVWIAVIDSATDACCRWRDGLLVSEIEKELGGHKDEDAECALEDEGLVPPIHFNCRCTLAPATDNIPDKPDIDSPSFEQWLETP